MRKTLCSRLTRLLYLSFWMMYHSRWRFNTNTQFILYGTESHWYAKPCLARIIFTAIIIGIEKFLKPLQEFKVVLKATTNQFVNWNYLGEFHISIINMECSIRFFFRVSGIRKVDYGLGTSGWSRIFY